VQVTIVIPTLNEEEGIVRTLDSIDRDAFRERGWELEILVVDGDSKDRTRLEAKRRGATVIVEARRGYGRAYKTGLAAAKGDVVVTGDADGTYPFHEAHRYIEILDASALDFITTDRFAAPEKGAMSGRNRFGNWVLSLTMQVLFLRRVRDSQSGMWIFRRDVLDRMPPLEAFHDGMPFSEEIKIEAFCRSDIKAAEIPIPYARRAGDVKLEAWRDGIRNLMFLLRKRFSYRRRIPRPSAQVAA
jgi:dolichol-phosphate hexosyltransferase